MRPPLRPLPLALVLLVLLAGALAGCGGAEEDSAAVAIARSGLLGGLGEQLKREDDEAEVAELRAAAPQTREERVEDREAAEATASEEAATQSTAAPVADEEEEGS